MTSETVDRGKIIDVSALITRTRGILVGSYLCCGLMLKERYAGLALGLKILSDICEQHWDCLFPPAKSMLARATAFAWLSEKAGLHIGANAPTAADSAAVLVQETGRSTGRENERPGAHVD